MPIIDPQQQPDPAGEPADKPEVITRDEVQALVNSALASHNKRLEARFDRSLGELKGLLTQQPKPEPEDGKGKGDSTKDKIYEQKLVDLQRRLDEADAKTRKAEDDRRRDTTRGQLRQHLENSNVRKELLDMVVTYWEANGTLRYDEEGKPLVSVKRSRSKNAAEEEMTFDDLKAGVEDFVKRADAAVLLKPPSSINGNTAAGGKPGQIRTYDKPAQSEEEAASRMAEMLGGQLFVNE